MIRENVLKIKERISLVCSKINRDPNSITIVAVSKGRTKEEIREAIETSITDIGESKVQEAILKYNELRTILRQAQDTSSKDTEGIRSESQELRAIKWHLVGHLQTNKAKDAVEIFDLIHSVDSLRLAQKINEEANKINKVQDILMQVNTSGEVSKFGLKPFETIEVIKEIRKLKNIDIKGLMTIAPLIDDPEKTRSYFKILRELRDKINELRTLSMGMTDDFEVAIEEGANMIRLGRAIFENAD